MVPVIAEKTELQENFRHIKIISVYLNFYDAAVRVLVISRDVITLVQ
jgi:hypothetical protein